MQYQIRLSVKTSHKSIFILSLRMNYDLKYTGFCEHYQRSITYGFCLLGVNQQIHWQNSQMVNFKTIKLNVVKKNQLRKVERLWS